MTVPQNWKQIAPGVYDDRVGGMHISCPEFLEANGYEPTEENIETIAKAWAERAEKLGVVVEVHE